MGNDDLDVALDTASFEVEGQDKEGDNQGELISLNPEFLFKWTLLNGFFFAKKDCNRDYRLRARARSLRCARTF